MIRMFFFFFANETRHLTFDYLLVMSTSPQIVQGVGNTVGSTVVAPTRVKDAGNSNLGTFGVCGFLHVHCLLPFFT
jgi:hypothetical protein